LTLSLIEAIKIDHNLPHPSSISVVVQRTIEIVEGFLFNRTPLGRTYERGENGSISGTRTRTARVLREAVSRIAKDLVFCLRMK
jgi:hypothetical protein